MTNKDRNRKVLSISIPEPVIEETRELAFKDNRNLSNYIETVLINNIEQSKKQDNGNK